MSRLFVLLRAWCLGFVPVLIIKTQWLVGGDRWILQSTDALFLGLGLVFVVLVVFMTSREGRFHRALSGIALYVPSAALVFCAGSAFLRAAWSTCTQITLDWDQLNQLSSWLPQFVTSLGLALTLFASLIVLHRFALFAELQIGSIDCKCVELPRITGPLRDIEQAAEVHCGWSEFRKELTDSALIAMAPTTHRTRQSSESGDGVSIWDEDDWFSKMEVNPANGVPMIEGTAIDVMGNPYGFDDH